MTIPICTDPITDEEIAAIVRERIEEGADLAIVRGTAPRINRHSNGDACATVCIVIPAALIAATRAAHLDADDDKPRATLRLGDETYHDGPGWYYISDEYPDEGSCGAFNTPDEAVKHAEDAGYSIDRPTQPQDAGVIDVPHEGAL